MPVVNLLALPCLVNSELQDHGQYLPMLEEDDRYYRKKKIA